MYFQNKVGDPTHHSRAAGKDMQLGDNHNFHHLKTLQVTQYQDREAVVETFLGSDQIISIGLACILIVYPY